MADDHPATVDAVVTVLEETGIDVVGLAADGVEALAKIEELRPRVAVVDVFMPGLSGTDIVEGAASLSPATGVILYTGYGERSLLLESLDAGARGFVLKEAPVTDLVQAITVVAEGGTYVDPVLAGLVATSTSQLQTLTRREREILRLLVDGYSNEEIGLQLYVSPQTVRMHARKAMAKLEADTRTQAVASALRQSVIA